MKRILYLSALLLATHCPAQTTNDIHLYCRVQWSTNNGLTWLDDLNTASDYPDFQVGGQYAPSFTNANYFFRTQITDNHTVGSGQAITFNTLYGQTPTTITNIISDFQAIALPSSNTVVNPQYRIFLTMTNFVTGSWPATTNVGGTNPPPPTP